MKTSLRLLTVLAAFLFVSARSAHAKIGIPIFYSTGTEKIVKVADFPDTGAFKLADGSFLDAGYKFKQVQLFWLPLWNYGGEWCGYEGKDDSYIILTKAELDSFALSANVKLPESPSLGFWNAFGGKAIVILLLIGALAIFLLPSKDD